MPQLSGLDVVIRSLPTAYEVTFKTLMQEIDQIEKQLASETTPGVLPS